MILLQLLKKTAQKQLWIDWFGNSEAYIKN